MRCWLAGPLPRHHTKLAGQRARPSPATVCRKLVLFGAVGHQPVHWGHPSGEEATGRTLRPAHCGRPPCSADPRFSCLAPCGPDGRLLSKLEVLAQAHSHQKHKDRDKEEGTGRPGQLTQSRPVQRLVLWEAELQWMWKRRSEGQGAQFSGGVLA